MVAACRGRRTAGPYATLRAMLGVTGITCSLATVSFRTRRVGHLAPAADGSRTRDGFPMLGAGSPVS